MSVSPKKSFGQQYQATALIPVFFPINVFVYFLKYFRQKHQQKVRWGSIRLFCKMPKRQRIILQVDNR